MAQTYERTPAAVERLTPRQRAVTQDDVTEPPFANEVWDSKQSGIYVDVVPLEPDNVVERSDIGHGLVRTEVRSAHGDSHLGHLFPDGPAEAGGLRYCINSASLRFIAAEDLEAEGYGQYAHLFAAPDGPAASDGGVA